MIYTFGCSNTKWHWPTWADWLKAYGHQVRNMAGKGFCHNFINWLLLDRLPTLTKNDHVIIMWPSNHRLVQWYDREWIDKYDCMGFFPDTQGRLWLTEAEPYLGLYRTHPDHDISRTHGLLYGFYSILQSQLLLDSVGCKYTMTFSQNPWLDARPSYIPQFKTKWQELTQVSETELEHAKKILKLPVIQNLLNRIDWQKFVDPPNTLDDVATYLGIIEYNISNREFVVQKHNTDHHPVTLAHHDFAWSKIMNRSGQGPLRSLAQQIGETAMNMPIPEYSADDYVASPDTQILSDQFDQMLKSNLTKIPF